MLHNIFKQATPAALPASDHGQFAKPTILAGVLFGLCVLFIVYQTAIPFRLNLTHSGLQYRWDRSEWIPFLDNDGSWLSLADAIGNILLFIPFGFFLHHWRLARATESIGMRASVLAGLLCSCMIEIFQLGLDRRTTSTNDIVTNLAGTYIGVRLALARPELIGVFWKRARQIAQRRPVLMAWLALMALQTVVALSPFDFTLQQENFQRQWLRWQYSWGLLPNLLSSRSYNSLEILHNFPHHEFLLTILIAAAGLGFLIGASWVWGCQQYGKTSPRIFWGLTIATLIFYPVLSLLQFMVQSVRPVVMFPLVGMGGIVLGAVVMLALTRLKPTLQTRRANYNALRNKKRHHS